MIGLLERENEFLGDQVQKKDVQIADLSKRFGETQAVLGATQRMDASACSLDGREDHIFGRAAGWQVMCLLQELFGKSLQPGQGCLLVDLEAI
jgi:hypothetical protein